MPTYEYQREDGTRFEIEQRITEEPLKECPTTGQKVKRLISGGAGLVFKGSGFYLTDYARKSSSPATSSSEGSSSGSSSTSGSGKEGSSGD
ncbi:MAG: zinc ribbon domain-containing protein [Bacteroidota bacterium]|nr:zinc ribbon domain-containing protein [Bacteroidota bacterium]